MKLAWSMLKILAAVYLLMLLLVVLFQRRLIYFPTPAPLEPVAEEFRVETRAGSQRGWVLHPDRPRAALYFGGNAEAVEHNLELFQAALPGRAVYLMPYRGYAGNPGRPSERGILEDALAAYDQLAARHRSVAVIGRSLGSSVAVQLAAQRPVERLVLVTPFDSILRLAQRQFPVFPLSLLLRDKFESWRPAPRITAPTLVLIAGRDGVVPAWSSQRLLQALGPAGPEVVEIPDAGHNDIQAYPVFSSAIAAFLGPGQE
ncbi:MAG: hypothetical protein ISR76_02730 [Planctomycetes bacterium]|nr:hypothetical protein [Planctomycetota bacterium]MBL7007885.1 hypothetical protein [Planctomycetota bacterium]